MSVPVAGGALWGGAAVTTTAVMTTIEATTDFIEILQYS
jgi:hypothetical protein